MAGNNTNKNKFKLNLFYLKKKYNDLVIDDAVIMRLHKIIIGWTVQYWYYLVRLVAEVLRLEY